MHLNVFIYLLSIECIVAVVVSGIAAIYDMASTMYSITSGGQRLSNDLRPSTQRTKLRSVKPWASSFVLRCFNECLFRALLYICVPVFFVHYFQRR